MNEERNIQNGAESAEKTVLGGIPSHKGISGIYTLYKGEEPVCDISFNYGKLLNIKTIHNKDRMPPFFPEKDKPDERLWMKQFLADRMLPLQNRYYGTSRMYDWETYLSLLDGYYLKINPSFSYAEWKRSYMLENDPFANYILKQASYTGGISPNLSLPFSELSLLQLSNGIRYLLQEYSRELADKKKQNGISYTIQIIQDIPFIQTILKEGDYYPVSMVTPRKKTGKELLSLLKEIDPSFDGKGADSLFLRNHDNVWTVEKL